MSLLPYIIRDLVNAESPVERLYDQHFGLGLHDDDVNRYPAVASRYLRPLRSIMNADKSNFSIQDEKDQFQINLDVQQFKPDEIKVKVENNNIIVEGVHEERADKHGFISRKFTRRCKVPPNTNLEEIKSKLSSDGVLSIIAPKKAIVGPQQREIPIQFSNKPVIKQSATTAEESKNSDEECKKSN